MPVRLKSDQVICEPIRCLLSDVDGVLTDGRIIYTSEGHESKEFHARDGLGIKRWMQSGLPFGIITARSSPIVSRRCEELGVTHVVQASRDKLQDAHAIAETVGCTLGQMAYIGDDQPDVKLLREVGLAAVPADAARDAKQAAHWILKTDGGAGVVRELIERIMRAQATWELESDRLKPDQSA
ncbi:3-deoxy-D-manno-octulosonate 8-phosphate phosphatase KdsC [Stieleria bergensis]|uniref:3-deoxy-D-manno-octulosonate 8-phosphate phosphatase KdsC n=1 Tax=Stieleria bergensis TaxID=2528025 RepID=A0A517SZL0_9BACT|nr:3-deoxy-D-manno-octulosonate 8-phosphate phosphatase KdsC [Planctomycetes bacterium SV_7m_r]